jgi:hypothetical protein
VAASTFARGYLDGVVAGVFGHLQRSGFFYDPVEREVQEQLLPWLRQQAQEQLATGIIARRVGGWMVHCYHDGSTPLSLELSPDLASGV